MKNHCSSGQDRGSRDYDRCKPRSPSALGQDNALAAELWRRSEAWVSADAPS